MAAIARGNPARWWKSRSCGGASRAPGSLFVGGFRRWTSRGALALLLLLIGGVWFVTNPARLARLSEVLLSRVLGGQVTVRSARLSFSGTLMLAGVEVRTPAATEGGAGEAATSGPATVADQMPILSAEQIEARFDWTSLLSGQLTATQLVAVRPIFRAIEDRETGQWNYERLRQMSPAGDAGTSAAEAMRKLALPVVLLRDGRMQWCEAQGGRVEQTGETIIDGQLVPDARQHTIYQLQFAQRAAETVGDAATRDGAGPVGVAVVGTWDVANNVFSATTRDVVMSDALKMGMPRPVRDWCDQYHLNGQIAQMTMTFSKELGLVVSVELNRVSLTPLIEPEQGIGMGQDRPAYPLPLTASGTILFLVDRPEIQLTNLHGEALGYQFNVNGTIHGFSPEAPLELTLEFPGAVLGDTYPPLFMASLSGQDLLQRSEPHGRMDIAVMLARAQARGPVTLKGRIQCHDARMRFAHFPYPLQHLNGLVTFDQQSVFFHDVTAMADEYPVTITGKASTTWTNPAIDMTVTSNDVEFDDRLGACLPLKYAGVWDLFSLHAHGGFVCRVTRSNSFFDAPKVAVDVMIDRGGGYLRALPYAFADARGKLHFEADETRLDHLSFTTGTDGSGRVMLDGVVRHPGGDVSRLQPQLHITADVPLDERLRGALPDEAAARLSDTTLGGRVRFDGMVRSMDAGGLALGMLSNVAAGAAPMQVTGTVQWIDGALHKGDVHLTRINAEGALTGTALELRKFTAAAPDVGAVRLSATGKIDLANWAGTFNIRAQGDKVTLPERAPGIFPAAWAQAWKTYAPSGVVDVDATAAVTVHASAPPSPTAPASPIQLDSYAARLVAHDVTLANAAWPEPLRQINGSVEIVPGKVTMRDMKAGVEHVALTWSGVYEPESGLCALTGVAEARGFPQKWLSVLPEGLVRFVDTRKEDTTLKVTLGKLERAAAEKPWTYQGTLETSGLVTTGALALNTKRANLVGRGTYDATAGDFALDSVLAATDVRVNDRMVDSVTAKVAYAPQDKVLDITNIDGKIAGGGLQGTIKVHTAPTPATAPATSPAAPPASSPATAPLLANGGYDAELMIHNAQLADLLLPAAASDEERKKASTGMVSASLMIQEAFTPNSAMGDRTGRGELVITDGNIYNVPLAMGLMQVATLRLPVAHSFDHAAMSYYLRGDEITFERILLESPGINLAGAGTMSFANKTLDLSFLTETPHEFVIPVISPILQQTRNELLQLSVTGTVDNPKITPVPFSAITNALRALLPMPKASTVSLPVRDLIR